MTRQGLSTEAAYVQQGRMLFETVFRDAGYQFEAPCWDIRSLRTSRHKKTNSRLYFTLHGSKVIPLPPRFSNVVKAYVLLNKSASVGAQATQVFMLFAVSGHRLIVAPFRPRCP